MVSVIQIMCSAAFVVVPVLAIASCDEGIVFDGTSKAPRPTNQRSFGYALNGTIHGCHDEDACWIGKAIAQIDTNEVVRMSPSGTWFVSVPKMAWARHATEKSRVRIYTSQNQPVEVDGVRFLRFVGKYHFTVSDKSYTVYLVGRNGDRRRLRSSSVAISESGRIASVLASGRVRIWNSLDSYFEDVESWMIEQNDKSVVSLQWLGDVLAVERGSVGDVDNSVAFHFPEREADCVLPRHSAINNGTGCLVAVFDHNREVYKRPLKEAGRITWQDVKLPDGVGLTSISPDGRYVLVATHPDWPPGAWPVSSLRTTEKPKKTIHPLGNNNVFQGWVRCNCKPVQ